MTTEPDTNTEVGMPTTIQPDAFGAVLALITLIGDARASAARLAELRAAVTTAEQAQANLIAARTAHDAHVAATEAGRA
jgi:hypothetical protein